MSNLKHYRKLAGLSQSELGYMAEISPRSIQEYEQGRKPLKNAAAITVLNLSRVLNCSVEDLIDKNLEECE